MKLWDIINSVLRRRPPKLPGRVLLMARQGLPVRGDAWIKVGVFAREELRDAEEDYAGRQVMATGRAMMFHFRRLPARVGDE